MSHEIKVEVGTPPHEIAQRVVDLLAAGHEHVGFWYGPGIHTNRMRVVVASGKWWGYPKRIGLDGYGVSYSGTMEPTYLGSLLEVYSLIVKIFMDVTPGVTP